MNKQRKFFAAIVVFVLIGFFCLRANANKLAGVRVEGVAKFKYVGDYVQVRYAGVNWINFPTAYNKYVLWNVPSNVIVVARIRNDERNQSSSGVAGATWQAQNGVLTMPNLYW